ncbi:MAG: CHASE4 domain-containing protein [Methanoregula sp.]|nr:CHASE4 domain-containing protein [Methanoregula sp.]
MDIRKKTVVILCAAIACLILVLLVLSQTVVLDGFSRVEDQSAQKDTNRVLVALGNDINTLDAVAHDWASRDDTRTFLLTTTSAKSWSQLDPDTFERLQFNYILLIDTNGTLISGKGYNLDSHTEKPVPPDLAMLLSSHQQIRLRIKSEFGTLGVLQFPEGPLMLAIRPVFSDPDQGQLIGYILMGRNLDAMELSRLSSLAQLPLELQPYSKADLPADFRMAISQFPQSSLPFLQREGKEALTIDAPTYIMPVGSNMLGTFSLIRDLSGQPVLILKVSIVRDIYDQGKSTILYFLNLLIIAGLVFGLAILLLLEKTVLSRILHLSWRLNDIGKKRDFSARVQMSGDDEIGSLAENVNVMISELETSQKQLQGRLIQSEEKYRLFFNSITDPVIIYRSGEPDTYNLIIEANDAASGILGYSHQELLLMSPAAIIVRDVYEEKPELSRLTGTVDFVQYESSYRAKSGKLIPVEINARIFDKFGQRAVLTIARDITDRKMAEKALLQAHKKLNLLNFVTFNDIQNSIFTLSGYISLQKDLPTDTKIDEYLEKEDATLRKISHSLDFAKNYQDMGIKPLQWHNVNQTFVLAISHLDFSQINRRVSLDDLEIFADPLLERVFFTLAGNLITHGKTATQVIISYQETAEGLKLIFEDNGAGIPDNLKEKIFQRGFGAQKGMSLFLAREILEITGITIRETGTYGNGARFEISVPRGSFRFPGKKG